MSISEQNKEAGKYYGYEAQSSQLIEESAELIQAINKYRRASISLGMPVDESKKERALDNLKEEIVDVEIMLEQIKYLLGLSNEELAAIKVYKVNRTMERISARERA